MPSPSAPATFNRPDLGLHFEEFDVMAAQAGFIGPKLMPIFPASLQTASFSKITVASLLEDFKLDRAPGSGYERGTYQFVQDSFACIERGTEEPVDDSERAIYAYSFDVEDVAARRCMMRLIRGAEQRIVAPILASSYTSAAVADWGTPAAGVPFTDILVSAIKIRNRTGLKANAVAMDWETFERCRQTDQVINRLKFWGGDDPKSITADVLAKALNVDYVFVAGASSVKNTAGHGMTASISPIWDKSKVAVMVVPTGNDLRQPCYGRTFQFTGDGGGQVVEQYRDERIRSEIIRARHWTDEKAIYPAALDIITGVG